MNVAFFMDKNTVKINLFAAIQGLSEGTEKSSVLSPARLLHPGVVRRCKMKADVWISEGKETKADVWKLMQSTPRAGQEGFKPPHFW